MWRLLAIPALLAIGCSGEMRDEQDTRNTIYDLRGEVTRHRAAVNVIDSLPRMHDETGYHFDRAMPMLTDMQTSIDSMMSHCHPMSGLPTMHREMVGELSAHASAMDAAPTVYDARAEVERYVSTMMPQLDSMNDMMSVMTCD